MNILLIAYYYPPINSGGTERPLKMVKYLSQFGHKMTVLTHSYSRKDISQPGEIRIYDVSHNKDRTGFHKFTWSCLRGWTEFLNIFGKYHSIYSFWKQNVIKTAEEIISQVKPDAIIATYPPIEDLEIGLYFSKRYNIPLIADFRDGLLFESIEVTRIDRYRCIRLKYERIEKYITESSSLILTVSPSITEYFINAYQCKNVVTIPNGFDPEDFEYVEDWPAFEPEKFHIVHTGRFGGSDAGCQITPFVNALRKLVSEYPKIRKKLRLHLLGVMKDEELSEFRELLEDGIIVLYGLLDRNTALSFQKSADLLLLITSVSRTSVATSKVFEYLYASKPILALTSRTYAEEIIHLTGSGWTVHPHDETKIHDMLYKIITNRTYYQSIHPSAEEITEFSRKKQMEELDKKLHEVCS